MPVNIDKFVRHLGDSALRDHHGKGKCGEYVRKALQAGGANFHGTYPAQGKLFGPALEMLGFHQITVDNPDTFIFQRGDVMVMEPYKGSTNHAGHVAGFDGKSWISDFVQRDFWAGPGYRNQKPRPKYAVYRY
jgi:hypothetical protein